MEHVVNKIKLVKTRVERVENETERMKHQTDSVDIFWIIWKMEQNVIKMKQNES